MNHDLLLLDERVAAESENMPREIPISEDDLTLLLKSLYAEADQLQPADWKTKHLNDFHKLCSSDARSMSNWVGALDAVESRVNRSWDGYRSLLVTERERTAETLAGHRLLVEGLAGWLEAVELCREGDFEAAREAAVEANRLLVLVQRQGRRLSRSSGRFSSS